MAKVKVTLCSIQRGNNESGVVMPIPEGRAATAKTVTTTATSKPVGLKATSADHIWAVTPIGGNVHVNFGPPGATLLAGEDKGWLVVNGATAFFAATLGDDCAIMDAV